jgi:hypothetical protein
VGYDGSASAFTVRNASIPHLLFQDNFDAYAAGIVPTGAGTDQWSSRGAAGTGFAEDASNAQASSAPNALRITRAAYRMAAPRRVRTIPAPAPPRTPRGLVCGSLQA